MNSFFKFSKRRFGNWKKNAEIKYKLLFRLNCLLFLKVFCFKLFRLVLELYSVYSSDVQQFNHVGSKEKCRSALMNKSANAFYRESLLDISRRKITCSVWFSIIL